MAMKESNKDRARRLAKEAEKANRLFALNEMATNAEELDFDTDVKPKSGVEGWVTNDAFPHANLTPKHLKWIAIGVGVAIVALLII